MTGQVGNPLYLLASFGAGSADRLAEVSYTLYRPDGSVYRATTQEGIEEIGGGDYQVLLGFNEEWQGYVQWNLAGTRFARESVEILPALAIPPSVQPYVPPFAQGSRALTDFLKLLNEHGSIVSYHRDDSVVPCPCLTAQGSRDPVWHIQNPDAPVCNDAGLLTDQGTTVEIDTRGFVHPVQSGAVRRLTSEQLNTMFGEVQSDDHLGILPFMWAGLTLDFYNWGESGEDWIEYNNRRFTVVSANLIPDPFTGNPWHHWECGLRYING